MGKIAQEQGGVAGFAVLQEGRLLELEAWPGRDTRRQEGAHWQRRGMNETN